MTIHLIKLCVGVDRIEDLESYRDQTVKAGALPFITTRNTPKDKGELLKGGSLYWVIKRVIQCRQKILDIETIEDAGQKMCLITLDPEIVRTAPQPRKAFQGWRYLKQGDAPADITQLSAGGENLPDDLRHQLIELGAW
ncbi:DUF1489 family protein [Woodsholea maritima]|uniref:DUF1489 family protein n=1 Tax=Woodsholea maritima TaxID=240237 RepID=UPI00037C51E7|nr:DUF1489 domain-containing protein [Woodsholea maritima]